MASPIGISKNRSGDFTMKVKNKDATVFATVEIYTSDGALIKTIKRGFADHRDAEDWIIKFNSKSYIGGLDDGTLAIAVGVW